MSLIFWIAVGSAIAALVLGLILKARLSDEDVWQELVDPEAPPETLSSEPLQSVPADVRPDVSIDSRQHSSSHGEEMNTPTPIQPIRSPRDPDLRRSSRIERPVPLLVMGTNRRGESFQERTSALSVNLHGCRYSSRHDYAPDGWVTLQVTGTDGAGSNAVRARVRSVLAPQSYRELCQVGVELESPGNVWGIPAPPEDWQRALGPNNSGARAATAVAPAFDPAAPPAAFLEKQSVLAERRSEVTVFPGPQSATPATASPGPEPAPEPSPSKDTAATKSERIVVTAEQILQALQGKIQMAADKAVQASVSTQFDEAVKSALAKIEESWRASVRQTEEFSAARLAEAQNLWEKELVVYRGRAEEISRRLEALTTNSQQALSDIQKFVERFARETAPQLHDRLNDSLDHANSEIEAKAAQVFERHLAQLAENTQLASREARSQIDNSIAEVRALVATTGGVPQDRIEALLNSFRAETFNRLEERLAELHKNFEQQHDLTRHRTNDLARQVESLALESRQARDQHDQALTELRSLVSNAAPGETREQIESLFHTFNEETLSQIEDRLGELYTGFEQQHDLARLRTDEVIRQLGVLSAETHLLRSQHEQNLAELRSLSASTAAEIPQSQLDSLLNSSREQILNHLEWRLGEVSGHYQELLDQARDRADALAQQLERLTAETREQLAESRNQPGHAFRELLPQDLAVLEESVAHATREFETAAARASDRQFVRLMEQKQAVSQEVSLELEARASEARAGLQKAANTTLEEFRRRVEVQIDHILMEATERLNSSLSSLDAESRASVEARRRALESEVASAAEQSAMEFRSGIKAFLYSCLVAAVSAVDQHAQTTLAGLSNESANLPRALDAITNNSAPEDSSTPPKTASTSK
jgi:uncharacterized protein YicC (UPF0701 family)